MVDVILVKAKLHHFAAVCAAKKIEYDKVKDCLVSRNGDYVIFDALSPHSPARITRRNVETETPKDAKTAGLGDRVAAVLAAAGITKERVSRMLGRPCKCKERQRRLNELGRKAAAAIRKATGQERTADGEELDDKPA